MRTSGSTSAVQTILYSRVAVGSVAFLNNSLGLPLGSVVRPKDVAIPVGILKPGRGISLEQIGKPVWH
jgi:hypothetical protein